MNQIGAIVTRPFLSVDDAFSYQVYASTRTEEMKLVEWSPEKKEAFIRMQFDLRQRQYRAEYPDAVTEIILCDDVPAGLMTTSRTVDAILLVDIALLMHFRRAGIGNFVLHNLQKEGKKITLHVLKQNPAIHLYSRLGFVSVSEDSMYLRMEWLPG
jgi:ribosomal protein S18 acetylase RimI-like enzyme